MPPGGMRKVAYEPHAPCSDVITIFLVDTPMPRLQLLKRTSVEWRRAVRHLLCSDVWLANPRNHCMMQSELTNVANYRHMPRHSLHLAPGYGIDVQAWASIRPDAL